MSTSGNEVSDWRQTYGPERMLVLLGLDVLHNFRNDYADWTNSIANLIQLSWTSFVQAGDLSIGVIVARFADIINSLLTRGVSAKETLMDVFAAIRNIFDGALQSTTNAWRASELFEMMRGRDTSETSEASSEVFSYLSIKYIQLVISDFLLK